MMTREEYARRAESQEDWAPGWDAIDEAFATVYPGVEPKHYGTNLHERAMFGGNAYLDGLSFFPSPHGYLHLVTYGMSTLYVDEESFGGEHSGWGYEMTMKLAGTDPTENLWALDSLSHLARYTWTQKRWFEPYQFISGGGQPLRVGSDSLLTSYLVVADTEVAGVDSVHGRLDFCQLVGITQAEHDWLAAEPQNAVQRGGEFVARMAADGNPHLVTDLARTASYV